MNSTTQQYGGWSNHATQYIFFKLFDGFDPYDHFSDDQANMRDWLGEEIKEYAENQVHLEANAWAQTSNLAKDLALLFLLDVNWEEIAKHLYEICTPEEDGGVR